MTALNNDQIIVKFRNAFISISKVENIGPDNGMICTIYRGTALFHATYYSAYTFYNGKNLL